ncbi:dolichyl-diphosphooligosaccharide---protein glycosyltransferase [Nematocida ausubeli]|nr:dolichyl-diphosphooligosaccharide---protein glycosyltransferase [Nematocida ausubeli]KAI5147160.1 dolichyl-diphosphooligosaccharide---protein glycosyltransferase [Nematocida ausubeli]KAI5160515.1 dolichyl-diphosphooligosaccharide---protein glycosyltransferase [Nematocida ausubeli]
MGDEKYKHSLLSYCATQGVAALCLISVAYASMLRLAPIMRYGVLINEFDPWFNFRCSEYIWNHGILQYFTWVDSKTWVPDGREIYKTAYPMLFVVSNMIHCVLNTFVRVDHYTVCCLTPPIIFVGCLFLVRQVAAEFFSSSSEKHLGVWISIAIFSMSGSVFEKTMAGAYDYEGLSLFMSLLILYMYILQIKNKIKSVWGRGIIGVCIGVAQGIFNLSWGGSIFMDLLLYAHSFVSFSNWRILACSGLVTMGVDWAAPFLWVAKPVNIGKLLSFCLLESANVLLHVSRKAQIKHFYAMVGSAILVLLLVGLGIFKTTKSGALLLEKIKQKDKIYNVLYKKRAHPLVSSIVEHRHATKEQIIDMCGPLMVVAPILMVWGTAQLGYKKKNSLLLVMLGGFALSTLMFLHMERFAFLVAPFLAIFSADAFCKVMFAQPIHTKFRGMGLLFVHRQAKILVGVFMLFHVLSCFGTMHTKYKQVIVVMDGHVNGEPVIADDFRESAMYMKYNLRPDSVILSWWDYGYQITGMSGLSTVIDNNTNNYARISEVASILVSSEEKVSREHAFLKKIVPDLDTDLYIYTVCGYTSQYALSDLNKLQWIAKIAKEADGSVDPAAYYFKANGAVHYSLHGLSDVDMANEKIKDAPLYISPAMRDSLLFKLCFYQHTNSVTLHNLKLVHESSNGIVRLYKIAE